VGKLAIEKNVVQIESNKGNVYSELKTRKATMLMSIIEMKEK
jgi:hypothetical protein